MRWIKIRRRQVVIALVIMVAGVAVSGLREFHSPKSDIETSTQQGVFGASNAKSELERIEVKGIAPKTGYSESNSATAGGKLTWLFCAGSDSGADTDEKIDEKCRVLSGVLGDPYTGSNNSISARRNQF